MAGTDTPFRPPAMPDGGRPAGARRLRIRCAFQKPVRGLTALREPYTGWETWETVWGDLRPQPGREQLAAGRLDSTVPGTLRVRWSARMAEADASFRVLIEGREHAIVSVRDPDMRRRTLEFIVKRGAAS